MCDFFPAFIFFSFTKMFRCAETCMLIFQLLLEKFNAIKWLSNIYTLSPISIGCTQSNLDFILKSFNGNFLSEHQRKKNNRLISSGIYLRCARNLHLPRDGAFNILTHIFTMREIVKIFDMGPFDFQAYSQRALRTTIKTRLSPIFYCENNKNFE